MLTKCTTIFNVKVVKSLKVQSKISHTLGFEMAVRASYMSGDVQQLTISQLLLGRNQVQRITFLCQCGYVVSCGCETYSFSFRECWTLNAQYPIQTLPKQSRIRLKSNSCTLVSTKNVLNPRLNSFVRFTIVDRFTNSFPALKETMGEVQRISDTTRRRQSNRLVYTNRIT